MNSISKTDLVNKSTDANLIRLYTPAGDKGHEVSFVNGRTETQPVQPETFDWFKGWLEGAGWSVTPNLYGYRAKMVEAA